MSPERRRATPEELLSSKVRANVKRALRFLWVADVEYEELCESIQPTPDAIRRGVDAVEKERGVRVVVDAERMAAEMSLTDAQVAALAVEMGLGPRGEPECYLPPPEEIREETAKFRASWTPAERESRLRGPTYGRMEYDTRRDN
jgi:hypothetical protein